MSIPAFRHDLIDTTPVGDDEASEAQPALEDVGDQVVVAMNLAGGRAGVGDHDDPGAVVDGRLVRGQEELEERRLIHLVGPLVEQVRAGRPARLGAAEGRSAIPDEVLRRSRRGVVGTQA